MLYTTKLCVLTLVVFLAVLTGVVLALCAWPNGQWGILNTLMTGYSVVMFAASWYLIGCYRFIEKPKSQMVPSSLEGAVADNNRKVMLHDRDRNGPNADTEEQTSDGIGGHQYGDLD